jgi:hypothetical protein
MGFRTSNRVSEEVAVRTLYFRQSPNWRRSQDMNPAPVEKLRATKNFDAAAQRVGIDRTS